MGRWKAWEKVADGPFQGTPRLSGGGPGSRGYSITIRDKAGNVIYHPLPEDASAGQTVENLGGAGVIGHLSNGDERYATGTNGRLHEMGWDWESGEATGWKEVPGSPQFVGPVSSSWSLDGIGDVLGESRDHHLLNARVALVDDTPKTTWKWQDLGIPGEATGKKGLNGPPTAAFDEKGMWRVLVRGQDNHLWHISTTPTQDSDGRGPATFGEWTNLGGGLSQPPIITRDRKGIEAFVVGEKSEIWSRRSKGRGWGPWEKVGGEIKGMPAVTNDPESGDTFLFARGSDDQLWYRRRTGGTWKRWQAVGEGLSGSPALWWELSWGEVHPAELSAVVLRNDGELWQRTYRLSGSG